MKNLHALLKDADPLVTEAPLSKDDAQAMRRVVVSSEQRAIPLQRLLMPVRWTAFAVGALVIAVIGAGYVLTPAGKTATRVVEADPPPVVRRQVQFVSAGGTRIIWVLNSEFDPPTGSNR